MRTSFDDDWIAQRVISLLADRLGKDPSSISRSDRLVDLSYDSLDLVESVVSLEDEFGGGLSDDKLDQIATVQDLIEEIQRWRS